MRAILPVLSLDADIAPGTAVLGSVQLISVCTGIQSDDQNETRGKREWYEPLAKL